MDSFFLDANRMQFKIGRGLFLLVFVVCEMFLPIKVWAQALSDTGNFSFTGGHNPVRIAQNYREFLPGDGLRVGPVQLHAFLGVAEVWTDNVFRRNKGPARDSDLLTTIAPGFQASLPFGGKHSLLLDYRVAQFLYSKFSGNNALTQDGVGHLTLDYPGGLRVDVDANLVAGFDGRGSEVDSQQSDITKWYSNTFRTTVQMVGTKLGFRGGVRYTSLSFRNNGQDRPRDRNNAAANFTIFVPTGATISALVGGFVSDQNYDRNNQLDSFTYGVFTGFRITPSRQFSGELNIGYNILNFDRAPVVQGPFIPDLANPGSFIPDPSDEGTQLLNQRLALGGKQQKALFLSGNMKWRPSSGLAFRLRPFRLIQQAAVASTSTFTQTGIVLAVTQRLKDRIFFNGSLLYANSDFDGARSDNRYRFRTEIDYRTVKWLGFKLAYIFEKRFSNQTRFRYYSNTLSLSIQGFF